MDQEKIEEIKILSQSYKLLFEDVISQGEALMGHIDFFKNTITLCSQISDDNKKVVLLHEILHSIFEQLGFQEENDNEHLINALSTSLFQVFQDNKTLFSTF